MKNPKAYVKSVDKKDKLPTKAKEVIVNRQAALKSYNNVHVDAGVESASSHRLIEMMFDGLLSRLAQAKGAMQQKDMELKGQKITSAISIVLGLRDSLDLEVGGEVAANLDGLYDYIQRTLWQANLKNDESLINECGTLISQISSAWRQIGKS